MMAKQVYVTTMVITLFLYLLICCASSMPLPFTEELSYGSEGKNVHIAQSLLKRVPCFPNDMSFADSVFDHFMARVVGVYQSIFKVSKITGRIDAQTAESLLQNYLYDGYEPIYCTKHTRELPGDIKYLIEVPTFFGNRTKETTATLYDKHCNPLLLFRVRTKGQKDYNELTSDGNTPTGLYLMDLNSPEDDPKSYGPYNVNRATNGVVGNALVLVPNIRYGILLHTGEWDNWNTTKPMPDSHGCIHAWPEDVKAISDILTKQLNVTVRENPFGKRPYPFVSQGLLSVSNIIISPPTPPAEIKCDDERIKHLLKEITTN